MEILKVASRSNPNSVSGAIAGAIVVWVFFAFVAPRAWFSLRGTATYLEVAANLGIVAVPVALLMIGGEFIIFRKS